MRDHNTVFQNVIRKRDEYKEKRKTISVARFRYIVLAAACFLLVTVLAVGIPVMLSKKDAAVNYDSSLSYKGGFSGSDFQSNNGLSDFQNEKAGDSYTSLIGSENDTEKVLVSEGIPSDMIPSSDWPYYGTTEELINASTDIFTGEIIGVGKSVRDGIPYVVYKLSVSETYKGQESVKGLDGNVQTLEVPASESGASIEVGTEYLFLTVKNDSGVLYVVTIDQYAFPVDSEKAQNIINTID